MDDIPESVAIGVSLIEGGAVGSVMVIAVFMSNVPEALSAAAGMKKAGHSPTYILGLRGTVTAVCALSALFGYLFWPEPRKALSPPFWPSQPGRS